MNDILSKAERDEMRKQCVPISPSIVQPTADAMVGALCAHADAMDEWVEELKKSLLVCTSDKAPHGGADDDCPTYYDGCNCADIVGASARHCAQIDRNVKLDEEVATLKEKLARLISSSWH